MKFRYQMMMFDLDGTISDSSPGVFKSLLKGFRAAGYKEPTPQELRGFVGPPLWNHLTEVQGVPPETAKRVIEVFRERYREKGAFENDLYPGMLELMRDFSREGGRLAVVTSKPEAPAKAVLRYLGVSEYLEFISAADESDRGGGKEELILPVLKKSGVAAKDAVMIGDTRYDASGAANAGVNFIGVLYGFGSREEMEHEGGRTFAESVEELRQILIDSD
jgi:phosphoglycolate phosphatase